MNQVIKELPATEERIEEIIKETQKDEILKDLMENVKNGWPKDRRKCKPNLQPYWKHQAEISYAKGILLKGDRIIVPESLRRSILDSIHEGHQGMDKCKRRARQSVFWPSMNNEIEQKVRKCKACSKLLPSKEREELQTHELPTRPWQKVGTDLFEYAKKNYLIISDYYSLWPEVYVLDRIDAEHVIEVTKDCFARHGIAEVIMSDTDPNSRHINTRNLRRNGSSNI